MPRRPFQCPGLSVPQPPLPLPPITLPLQTPQALIPEFPFQASPYHAYFLCPSLSEPARPTHRRTSTPSSSPHNLLPCLLIQFKFCGQTSNDRLACFLRFLPLPHFTALTLLAPPAPAPSELNMIREKYILMLIRFPLN